MGSSSPRGYHPCAVCGEVHHISRGHVCQACIDEIHAYDALVADHDRGLVSIEVNAYPDVHGAFTSAHGSAAKRLESLLSELRHAASAPMVDRGEGRGSVQIPAPAATVAYRPLPTGYTRTAQTYLNVPAGLAQFFADLEPLINDAIDEAEKRGKQRGTDILASLAAGELTTADFERSAGIRREGERA